MIKLITAVIRPHRLDAVREALVAEGVLGMTVTEVHGLGSGHTEIYRGAEYPIETVSEIRLDVVVDLFDAEAVAAAVVAAARTGEPGDGKVWITDVEQVRRVRTGERDTDALR
jgi:nitrogen regulatory protein P-II 1